MGRGKKEGGERRHHLHFWGGRGKREDYPLLLGSGGVNRRGARKEKGGRVKNRVISTVTGVKGNPPSLIEEER